MEQIELSIVVPAFNEENSIESALINIEALFSQEHKTYEIVVVNDGSKDNTLPKTLMYAQKNGHVKIHSYSTNNGKGYAVKAGFMRSSGDVVVFADSDLEIGLGMISRYIEALSQSDIVIASKWHPQSRVEISALRRILSHSFNVLVKIMIGVNIRDTQVGLKAMKKSSFERIIPWLTVKRFAFDVELLAAANLHGLKIVEMPVQLKLNACPKFREIFEMFTDLLRMTWRIRVLRIYGKIDTKKRGPAEAA
ncbi:MAG: glycosyltransferase [Candidatus Bathyarchaeota archaeon]|nr:glycosyltransferase [Candidatus Bathyarchaeota archaeon]